jgi:hypothetical protein
MPAKDTRVAETPDLTDPPGGDTAQRYDADHERPGGEGGACTGHVWRGKVPARIHADCNQCGKRDALFVRAKR